jgi:hypothetical protein
MSSSGPNNAASRPPEVAFKSAGVSAAVWRKEVEQDGRTVVQFHVRVEKRYKDRDGKWQSSDYFFPDELPRLELVARKAFEYVALKHGSPPEAGENGTAPF